MPREENSPGPGTVQLFAGLYYMGDTNLPEYPYMVHNLILNNHFGVVRHVLHHNPPTILPLGLNARGSLQ